jgi:plasmid segregation protein ParM
MSLNSVVRAVDLGFGNAKFVVSHPPGGEVQCLSFPSAAPLAAISEVNGVMLDAPNTVTVSVDGKRYEVGPGVGVARDGCDHRILHNGYLRTPEYLALMRGIFHYMRLPVIDRLVVGLPLGHVMTRARELEKLLIGNHPTVGGGEVYVRAVNCLAQPVGGFLSYAYAPGTSPILRKQINLVIDVGFVTLDWLLCEGLRPIPQRSGHVEGGVSALLRRIAVRISEKHDVQFGDLQALDRALATGYLTLFGAAVPIAEYIPDARPVLDKALAALANSVGDGSDIHNIVVVGGGARLFLAAIQARFPKHPVVVVPDPLFANVRGFQLAGEYQMEKTTAA